jgi:hypothetical protein
MPEALIAIVMHLWRKKMDTQQIAKTTRISEDLVHRALIIGRERQYDDSEKDRS